MRKRNPWLLIGTVVVFVFGIFVIRGGSDFKPPDDEWGERMDGGYFTLKTEDGEPVTRTALLLSAGDRYINEHNELFEIVSVQQDDAMVRSLGKTDMPDVTDILQVMANDGEAVSEASELIASRAVTLFAWLGRLRAAAGQQSKSEVGIYHTHNAESYVPSSGTAFKEEGDVHEVGRALAKALEKRGHRVTINETSHLPHDGQAYMRSRRTAIQLSRQRPRTLLDVHRDAVPDADQYTTTVNGEQMSRVRLVVGRQNQNRDTNLEYAKRMKAIADEKYPGLIFGIFDAQGNYNQDLGPGMMLLEFGTHVTSLEDAIKSAEPMADVIAAAAGIAAGTSAGALGSTGSRTVLWIIVLAALGAGAWMILNREGWERFKHSLRGFTTKIGGFGDDHDDPEP